MIDVEDSQETNSARKKKEKTTRKLSMKNFVINEDYVHDDEVIRQAFKDVLGSGSSNNDVIDGDLEEFLDDDEDMDEEMAQRLREAMLFESGADGYEDEEDGLAQVITEKEKSARKPRRPNTVPEASIIATHTACSGCGADFQSEDEHTAGYIPKEKYEAVIRRKLELEQQEEGEPSEVKDAAAEKKEEPLTILDQDQGVEIISDSDIHTVEFDGEEEEEEEDQEEERVICQRCYKLMHYGQVEESLRPGWSEDEFLTPKRFQDLLSVIRTKRCVVVYLTDLFDFSGSLLWNLHKIVGDNPVMLAVNKMDLLPKDLSKDRALTWVHNECKRLGLNIPRKHISIVSCKTGNGVDRVVRDMRHFARDINGDIYVIGAANVGKSTFINHLLKGKESKGSKSSRGKKVTTSPIPGTTLDFVKLDIGGTLLVDTPGLILPHQLTISLDSKELKAVLPEKQIEHVTLRVGEGKSVLIGGLARLDMVEGKPFFFTFFISNKVKLHPTPTNKAEEILQKHIGKLVFPPFSEDRLEALTQETVSHEFTIHGAGWKRAAKDLHISGLGFIGVTGAGTCKVRITAPKNVMVLMRDALMPYDSRDSTAKFTGGRTVKKGAKKGGRRV